MKILHIIESVGKIKGGQPRALVEITNLERNCLLIQNSDVLSLEEALGNETEIENTLYSFPKSFPERFNNSSLAISWLKKNISNYDVVILHGVWNFLIIRSALTVIKYRKKLAIWPHGSLLPQDLKKKAVLKFILGKFLVSRLIRNAHALCLTSSNEYNDVNTFGVSNVIKKILPLPVTLENVDTDKTSKNLAERNDETFNFIFVGRIDYKKGLDLFIEAFSNCLKNYPHIRLNIWGSGSLTYLNYIKGKVKLYNLENVVTFCGFLNGNDKYKVFNDSDCFILTSMFENFGITPIEALQAGTPVLVSDKVDIYTEIKEAAYVCHYEPESIEKQIRLILSDKRLYLEKKNSAIQTGQKFLPIYLSDIYKEFYDGLK